jgi:hypothetical protein
MYLEARFISTPNEPIVIANASPELLRDTAGAAQLRRSLSRSLGELPVVLRYRQGNIYAIDGDEIGRRYAFDPLLESLPVVGIVLEPRLPSAGDLLRSGSSPPGTSPVPPPPASPRGDPWAPGRLAPVRRLAGGVVSTRSLRARAVLGRRRS